MDLSDYELMWQDNITFLKTKKLATPYKNTTAIKPYNVVANFVRQHIHNIKKMVEPRTIIPMRLIIYLATNIICTR